MTILYIIYEAQGFQRIESHELPAKYYGCGVVKE